MAEDVGPGFVAISLLDGHTSQLLAFLSSEHHFPPFPEAHWLFSKATFSPQTPPPLMQAQLARSNRQPCCCILHLLGISPHSHKGWFRASKTQPRGKKGKGLSAELACPTKLAGGYTRTTADSMEGDAAVARAEQHPHFQWPAVTPHVVPHQICPFTIPARNGTPGTRGWWTGRFT